MKIALHSNTAQTIYSFRRPLIRALLQRGWEVTIICDEDLFFESLSTMGARLIRRKNEPEGVNPFKEFVGFLKLLKLFRQEQFDIVHHYTPKGVIFGSLASKIAGSTTIASITGLGRSSKLSKFHPLRIASHVLYRLANCFVDQFIFLNKDDMDYFLKKKLTRIEKAILIDSEGVDLNEYKRSSDMAVPTHPVTFTYVGRLLKIKGVQDFLDASCKVSASYPEAKFLMAGFTVDDNSGYLSHDEIKAYQNKLPNLTYLGMLKDVRPVYSESSVVVFPSFYGEGIPFCLLEAMAFRLPLITTDNTGCRETVKNGKNGFLVPVRHIDQLAAKMVYFLENTSRISPMGEESLRMVEEKFSSEVITSQILKVYERTHK